MSIILALRKTRAGSAGALKLLSVLAAVGLMGACLKKGPPERGNRKTDAAPYTPARLHAKADATARKPPAPRRGGAAVVHLDYEPPHLNLFLQEDFWISRLVLNHIQESLVRIDGRTGKLHPHLATAWDYSKDGLELTLNIRKDVTFHDGHPFDVDDVKFTFEVLMDPERSAAALGQDFAAVKSFKVRDGAFVLNLKRHDFKLLSSLAHLPILPRNIYATTADMKKNPASSKPVGTGPFQVSEWKRGQRLVFRRYSKHWGRGARLDRLVFKVVRDTTKALHLLKKGELDFIPRVPVHLVCGDGSRVKALVSRPTVRSIRTYPKRFHSIILNVKTPQLREVEVRRALARLTPRELIARSLLCQHARLITGPFWPDRPGYDPKLPQIKYSLKEATRILKAAGWRDTDGDGVRDKGGHELKLTFLQIAESSLQRRLCPVLKDTYRRAGVQLDLVKVPFSRWLRLVRKHNFHMADVVWSFFGAQDLYQHYHCSQANGGSNYGSFCNPKVDTLLQTIRRTLDPKKRTALERKLHRRLYEALPAIYLFNTAQISLARKRLRGCTPNSEGFPWSQMWIGGNR